MPVHFTVRRTGNHLVRYDKRAYAKLLSDRGLGNPSGGAFSTANWDPLKAIYPFRLCLWQSRTEAEQFAAELTTRTAHDWFVTIDPVESTAYHEAGHNVVAFALGRPIGTASIMPTEGVTGRSDFPSLGSAFGDTVIAEREIIIKLAGYAVQANFELAHGQTVAGQPVPNVVQLANGAVTNDGGFKGDDVQAFAIAQTVFVNPEAGIRGLAQVTHDLVTRPEIAQASEAVAAAFLATPNGTLEATAITNLSQTRGVRPSQPTERWVPPELWLAQ